MSDYIEGLWNEKGENWNAEHPYVQLRECFDGVEIVIQNVEELSIEGDKEKLQDTELVIDPRYGAIFNFINCDDINLVGMTMGHTELGECVGNVLNFSKCSNIQLDTMDIYGCGVYGIRSDNGTGELYVYNSTIRDCCYGPFNFIDGDGRFEFHDCQLIGSGDSGHIEENGKAELAFYRCVFGVYETFYFMQGDTEDCIWYDHSVISDESISENESSDTLPVEQDGFIHINTTEQLLNAVKPGANIFVEPGYYNMSEYIESLNMSSWNAAHPYVKIRKCFDGVEVVIQNVEGLSIEGDEEKLQDTELVIDARYGAIFNFINCNDINLVGMTMGHTERGECAGNVLNFSKCSNIQLNTMDIYGCGVYGIGADNGTGELYVYNSTIRDCYYGPLLISDVVGNFEFHDCQLTGSGIDDFCDSIEKNDQMVLNFYRCVFGDNETAYFKNRNDIYKKDCTWSKD